MLGSLIPATINALSVIFLTGLDLEFEHFITFRTCIFDLVGIYLFMAFLGYIFGMFFGVLCRDAAAAANFLPMVIIPMLMFAGLAVNINTIP